MTRTTLSKQFLTKIAVAVFLAILLAVPSKADGPKDFEVMVNGPWTFVVYADPSNGGEDRLYLVAPADKTHLASVWSGPNASMNNGMMLIKQKDPNLHLICPAAPIDANDKSGCNSSGSPKQYLYRVDFDSTKPTNRATIDEEGEDEYMETVRASNKFLAALLQQPGSMQASRYAISLPMPDHVHTYSGDFGTGVTEIRLENGRDPTRATPIKQYATWTILHYDRENRNIPVKITTYTVGDISPIMVPEGHEVDRQDSSSPIIRYGISFSLMEAPLCNNSSTMYYPRDCTSDQITGVPTSDPDCDPLSGLSFALNTTIWGLNDRALFPSELHPGIQIPWNYDFTCTIAATVKIDELRKKQQQAASRNVKVAKLLEAIEKAEKTLQSGEEQGKTLKLSRDVIGTLTTEFKEIGYDLTSIFGNKVPDNLGTDFLCACTDAIPTEKQSVCALGGVVLPQCEAGADKKHDALKRLEKMEQLSGTDKGSADCHAPQISINGPIQTPN